MPILKKTKTERPNRKLWLRFQHAARLHKWKLESRLSRQPGHEGKAPEMSEPRKVYNTASTKSKTQSIININKILSIS